MSETLSRETVTFVLTDPEHRFDVVWRLVQPKDAPYLREEVTVTALTRDESVSRVDLFQANGLDAEVVGNTAGFAGCRRGATTGCWRTRCRRVRCEPASRPGSRCGWIAPCR